MVWKVSTLRLKLLNVLKSRLFQKEMADVKGKWPENYED